MFVMGVLVVISVGEMAERACLVKVGSFSTTLGIESAPCAE